MKSYLIQVISCFLFAMLMPLAVWAQDVTTSAGQQLKPSAAKDTKEPADTVDASPNTDTTPNTDATPKTETVPTPDHVRKVAPWHEDKKLKVALHTSLGDVTCELFAGAHPLTVLNFKALATGTPAWTDASGKSHQTPYYQELPFGTRVKNRYVNTSLRAEGTGFVIVDERCRSHQPVAGSIAMVQNYPGQAAAQFMLLASDIPVFKGMYAVFGQCAPIETIQKLTTVDAVLHSVSVEP